MKIGIVSGDERISYCPGGRLNTMKLVGFIHNNELGYIIMKSSKSRIGEQNPCTNTVLVASNEDTDSCVLGQFHKLAEKFAERVIQKAVTFQRQKQGCLFTW